jgi:glycogen operon protein
MLLHGDEGGRTQQGNNNTYAQDNELSWLHWDELDGPLVEFTARVAQLRRDHPTFRRRRFFTGTTVRTGDGERLNDIVWLHLDGRPMESADWDVPDARSLGMYLNGHGIAGADARGRKVVDDHFLLYFNAGADDAPLTLPSEEYAAAWDVVLDTGEVRRRKGPIRAGVRTKVAARSVVVLREHSAPAAAPETSAAASVAAQEQSAAQNGRAGTT